MKEKFPRELGGTIEGGRIAPEDRKNWETTLADLGFSPEEIQMIVGHGPVRGMSLEEFLAEQVEMTNQMRIKDGHPPLTPEQRAQTEDAVRRYIQSKIDRRSSE